jgi:amino acid permease
VIVLSLIVAFTSWSRSLFSFLSSMVSYVLGVAWAFFVEYTGLRLLFRYYVGYCITWRVYRKRHETVSRIHERRERKENMKALTRAKIRERERIDYP